MAGTGGTGGGTPAIQGRAERAYNRHLYVRGIRPEIQGTDFDMPLEFTYICAAYNTVEKSQAKSYTALQDAPATFDAAGAKVFFKDMLEMGMMSNIDKVGFIKADGTVVAPVALK